MIRQGSLRGECCFKCAHRHVESDSTSICDLHGIMTWGDAGHVCDDFGLDKTRYVTIKVQRYEIRESKGMTKLEDWDDES